VYDPADALEQLQDALVVLQSRYTEQHPEVIQTKKKIQALRQQIEQGGTRQNNRVRTSGAGAQAVIRVQREIGEVDAQLSALRADNERLKKQIAQLNSDITEMPLREQELTKIKRDYDNVQTNYKQLLAERGKAGIESSLIRSQKGTQFRIVEPAEMPTIPAGPPRLLIALGGVLLSAVLLGAVPLLLYFLNGAFRTKSEVAEGLGLQVLGVIPPMTTPEAMVRARRLQMTSAMISAVSFAAAAMGILVFI
jgi:uncharacterized protein involved in exopolysaccharide biosynthesis